MPNYTVYFRPKSETGEYMSHALVSAVLTLHPSADYFDVIGTITDVAGEHSDSNWIGEQFRCIGTDFIDGKHEEITSRKRLEDAFAEAVLPAGFAALALCETEILKTGDNL